MKIITRITLDLKTGKVLEKQSFEYQGPVANLKGGGGGTSTTTNNIPAELSGLYSQTGQNIINAQNQNPISQYMTANPTKVAGLSVAQERGGKLMDANLNDALKPLDQSEIVGAGKQYFESQIAPSIENQATLAGLGRSTALSSARASAEGATMLPLLQGEQARRDAMINQAMQVGDIQRGVEQEGYNAIAQDALRRQALAESALFGVMGQLPSTIGQTTKTKSSGGGGMFGK